jgi:(E)-4-hydroxy-3-methylbut-2-enyl-diphosphate synthase
MYSQGWGVPDFKETSRDTHTFSRRVGTLPEQREGDELDFRPLLHR